MSIPERCGRLLAYIRVCRSAIVTVLLRTHIRKWRRVAAAGPPTWDERNKIIARFIPAGSSVVDLGAGAQTLKSHLAAGCRYQPCDVVQSSPDVIFCDFNRGIYPELPAKFDYVVCSGVLEYVWKPSEFLGRVCALGSTLLLSYNPRMPGEPKLHRLAKNWVNHLDHRALENMLNGLGLAWRLVNTRQPNEYLYSITRADQVAVTNGSSERT
ncbi:MAG TPA: hypothetical protein VFC78_10935 [Tepidisphaeraceae bacterium]|nr:hypothetical protein [Tepidisphaeraceae bacterium]